MWGSRSRSSTKIAFISEYGISAACPLPVGFNGMGFRMIPVDAACGVICLHFTGAFLGAMIS